MKIRINCPRILPALLAGLVAACSAWLSQDAAAQTACTECLAGTISCNQSVTGELDELDCTLTDDTALDTYRLVLPAPTLVTITMNSAEIDSYLFLLDGACNVISQNDDCVGVNSCLTLSLVAGTYYLGANSFDVETGSYTLSVSCPVTAPTLSIAALPDGNVRVSTTAAGTLQSTAAFEGANTVWITLGAISPASPFVTQPGAPAQFYRVTVP